MQIEKAVIMIRRIFRESNGQDLVEYALLVAIVALGAVAALNVFKTAIVTAWTTISANLTK